MSYTLTYEQTKAKVLPVEVLTDDLLYLVSVWAGVRPPELKPDICYQLGLYSEERILLYRPPFLYKMPADIVSTT